MIIAVPASASMPLSQQTRKPAPKAYALHGIQASARCALTASSAVQRQQDEPGQAGGERGHGGHHEQDAEEQARAEQAARPIRPVRAGQRQLWPARAATCRRPSRPEEHGRGQRYRQDKPDEMSHFAMSPQLPLCSELTAGATLLDLPVIGGGWRDNAPARNARPVTAAGTHAPAGIPVRRSAERGEVQPVRIPLDEGRFHPTRARRALIPGGR